MTDVPKIVHSRLRAATPEREAMERAHPEADVLTAFAEQALSAAERESVLQHLTLCGDCRDVIALASPRHGPDSNATGGRERGGRDFVTG